jgi:hypothetical protein
MPCVATSVFAPAPNAPTFNAKLVFHKQYAQNVTSNATALEWLVAV